jgi:hypothetical protein
VTALDVMLWAMGSDLSASERWVLSCIAARATGSKGHCEWSVETIAERTGLSERGVQKILRRLVERALLLAAPRFRETTVYRVNEGALRSPSIPTPRVNVVRGQGEREGEREGERGAPDQIDQKDQTDVCLVVEGTKDPAPGTPEPSEIGALLQLQTAYGVELIPLPRLGDNNSKAIDAAIRKGWTVAELRTLFDLSSKMNIRVWSLLLSPKLADMQTEARRQARNRAVIRERATRPIGFDPLADPETGVRMPSFDFGPEPELRKAAK